MAGVLFQACLVSLTLPVLHALNHEGQGCNIVALRCECCLPPLNRRLPSARPQEAYQAQSYSAQSDDAEFPDMEWEGWHEIAERLGVSDTVDAPIFRQAALPPCSVQGQLPCLFGMLHRDCADRCSCRWLLLAAIRPPFAAAICIAAGCVRQSKSRCLQIRSTCRASVSSLMLLRIGCVIYCQAGRPCPRCQIR
jgi:hypothetical protein